MSRNMESFGQGATHDRKSRHVTNEQRDEEKAGQVKE